MADTGYTTASPETRKAWGEQLWHEALAKTVMYQYTGDGMDNIFQVHNDLQKDKGDECTITLRMQGDADGQTEGESMEGNEEALVSHTDKVGINELYNAVRTASRISDQRITWSIREEARRMLSDWWAGRMDQCMAQQITGIAVAGDTLNKRSGFNAVTAPSTNRHVFQNGAANEAALVDNTFNMTLSTIDAAVSIAETNESAPLIRPLNIDGEPHYVAFLHPWSSRDIRTNAAAGSWIDFNKGAGPRSYSDNNIFNGAMGVYNGVILRKWSRIPESATAKTRRNVLCGAYSAGGRTTWSEKLFDYDRQLGVSAGMIFGIKKAVYNSEDWGSIVMSAYASADGS